MREAHVEPTGDIMKVRPEDICTSQLGLPCLVRFSVAGPRFVEYSQACGFDMGEVSISHAILGRLSAMNESNLTLVDCYHGRHSAGITWAHGPRYRLETSYTVLWRAMGEHLRLILERSAIQRHLQGMDRGGRIWKEWPRFEEHLKSLGAR